MFRHVLVYPSAFIASRAFYVLKDTIERLDLRRADTRYLYHLREKVDPWKYSHDLLIRRDAIELFNKLNDEINRRICESRGVRVVVFRAVRL